MKNVFYADAYRIPSTRFQNWDYSWNGKYFITLCTAGMENIFGEIKGQKMILSHAGVLVSAFWHEIQNQHKNVVLDAFVVMPNHLHGIVNLKNRFDHHNTKSRQSPDLKIEKLAADDPMKAILQEVDENYLEYAVDKKVINSNSSPLDGNAKTNVDVHPPRTSLKIRHSIPVIDPAAVIPPAQSISELFREHNRLNNKEQNSICAIIESYKSLVVSHAKRLGYTMDWKEHFYDHLIHNDEELRRIRFYINSNVEIWGKDKLNGGRPVGMSHMMNSSEQECTSSK